MIKEALVMRKGHVTPHLDLLKPAQYKCMAWAHLAIKYNVHACYVAYSKLYLNLVFIFSLAVLMFIHVNSMIV